MNIKSLFQGPDLGGGRRLRSGLEKSVLDHRSLTLETMEPVNGLQSPLSEHSNRGSIPEHTLCHTHTLCHCVLSQRPNEV